MQRNYPGWGFKKLTMLGAETNDSKNRFVRTRTLAKNHDKLDF
jgi:hypothetical protein